MLGSKFFLNECTDGVKGENKEAATKGKEERRGQKVAKHRQAMMVGTFPFSNALEKKRRDDDERRRKVEPWHVGGARPTD
jgi:hypothetical protein